MKDDGSSSSWALRFFPLMAFGIAEKSVDEDIRSEEHRSDGWRIS